MLFEKIKIMPTNFQDRDKNKCSRFYVIFVINWNREFIIVTTRVSVDKRKFLIELFVLNFMNIYDYTFLWR